MHVFLLEPIFRGLWKKAFSWISDFLGWKSLHSSLEKKIIMVNTSKIHEDWYKINNNKLKLLEWIFVIICTIFYLRY